MEYLKQKDRDAIYLHFSCAYSKLQAYKETHPNASEETARKNSYKYFKRILKTFDTLPFKVKLEICGLGENRCLQEISKRLMASIPKYDNDGNIIHERPDNKTRMDATELLVKVNGLEKVIQDEIQSNNFVDDNEIRVIIDNGN